MKKHLLQALSICFCLHQVTAQQLTLVKDLNPGTANALDAWNYQAFNYNDILLLPAQDATSGLELCVIRNGKLSVLKDINPGTAGSAPSGFTLYKNKVYFAATTALNGTEIWSTDGTEAGTQLAIEVIPGTSPASQPSKFIVAKNGQLYFSQSKNVYVSDGTTAGTSIIPGVTNVDMNGDDVHASPGSATYQNGVAFVSNNRGDVNIYAHDGTTLTLLTTLELDFFTKVYGLAEVKEGLVFATDDSFDETLIGLFCINKTTKQVTEIKSTSNTPLKINRLLPFTNQQAIVKLLGFDGILVTDGTTAGTVKIAPGNYTLAQLEPLPNAVIGNKIIFHGGVDRFNNDFYLSDGTVSGTSIIASTSVPYFSNMISKGNKAFWAAGITNGFKAEIWSADAVSKTSDLLYTSPNSSTLDTDISITGFAHDTLYVGGGLGAVGNEIYALTNTVLAIQGDVAAQKQNLLLVNMGTNRFKLMNGKGSETLNIQQYDVNGRLVHSFTTDEGEEFGISKTSGVALLKVSTSNAATTFKVMFRD